MPSVIIIALVSICFLLDIDQRHTSSLDYSFGAAHRFVIVLSQIAEEIHLLSSCLSQAFFLVILLSGNKCLAFYTYLSLLMENRDSGFQRHISEMHIYCRYTAVMLHSDLTKP